jgi:hypothetical protein
MVRLLFSSLEDEIALTAKCSAHPKDLKLVFNDLELYAAAAVNGEDDPEQINEHAARKYLRRKKLLTEHEAALSGIC